MIGPNEPDFIEDIYPFDKLDDAMEIVAEMDTEDKYLEENNDGTE